MSLVLADASPLIHLARLHLLPLLQTLFGDVRAAEPVFDEVVGRGDRPGASDVAAAAWLRRETSLADAASIRALREAHALGEGEAATLAAAVRLHAELVLIDERRARAAARRLGLSLVGTLGVLELGHERHVLADLRAVYQQIAREGIRIAPALLEDSLRRFGLPGLERPAP